MIFVNEHQGLSVTTAGVKMKQHPVFNLHLTMSKSQNVASQVLNQYKNPILNN